MQVWYSSAERSLTPCHQGSTPLLKWEVAILLEKVLEKPHILGTCKLLIGITTYFHYQILGFWPTIQIAMIYKAVLIGFGVIIFTMEDLEEMWDVPKGMV